MNCREFEQRLGQPLHDEARAHMASCETCNALGRWFEADGGELPATRPVAIPADFRAVRPLPSPWLLAAGIFVAMATLALGGNTMGVAGWEALRPHQRMAIFAGLTVALGAASLLLARQMFPTLARRTSPQVCLGAALGAIFVGPVLLMPLEFDSESLAGMSTGCGMHGMFYAIAASVAIWLVVRRGYFVQPAWAGALSGLAAGLAALAVLEICCPLIEAAHVLIWHSGVVVVAVLLSSGLAYWSAKSRA